jgi:cytochrome b subunit of formate dehydrogenase
VATLHLVGAYMMLIFFIVHVYLATAGHTPTAHIKAMITGWEEAEDETMTGRGGGSGLKPPQGQV